MDLNVLQETLRTFAAERNWAQFHTPKNLSMALMVEAAELMKLFQWKTPEESLAAQTDKVLQMRIGEELADVLLYLVQLADQTGVDLNGAVDDKLQKNARKYPVPGIEVTSVAENVKPTHTHVLVDWENVQPKDVDIRGLVPDVTNVWIFHGPTQKRVGDDHVSFGDALTLVPISRPGKNALDFHLTYYVGYISSRNPNARFVVISNDQGYGPMVEHAKVLGFAASQVGFGTARVVAKSAPATKTAAKKAPAKKAAPAKKHAKPTQKVATTKQGNVTEKPAAAKKQTTAKKAKTASPVMAPLTSANGATRPAAVSKKAPVVDEEKAYSHVVASLRKSKTKPTRRVRLFGAVKSLLGAANDDQTSIERVIGRLIDEGHVVIDANGAVTKTL
ncbi:MAG: nucleotide pyrophosphohydrolase [Rhodoferax sp.]|nr:nucleotide pyrophosphohydrolase [Rhodoferax sp.]